MIVYTSRVFAVEVDRVRFPNGREHEVAIVRHPPSVVLIPTPADGQVVLIRQFRATIGRELWELPAGSLKPGESADDAAARECEEEIGLTPRRLDRLRGFYPTPGFCDEELIFYRASRLERPSGPRRQPDEDEDIQVHVFSVSEAQAMVERGDVVDLKTAYGLTLI